MTPEQIKANEITEKFYRAITRAKSPEAFNTAKFKKGLEVERAKQCALISCDESISILEKLRKPEYTTFIEWPQLKEKEVAETMDGYEYLDFWNKVKEEINSL